MNYDEFYDNYIDTKIWKINSVRSLSVTHFITTFQRSCVMLRGSADIGSADIGLCMHMTLYVGLRTFVRHEMHREQTAGNRLTSFCT